MNSWCQRRNYDYETSTKRLEWLKELKKRGFRFIDKEISFYVNRRDEALSRMNRHCVNH